MAPAIFGLMMKPVIKHDIALFDFLRGWSALFVFFHHASILGGGPDILSGQLGQEAVNVFMFASGFLIYFQCSVGKLYFGLKTKTGVANFYIRRFFRIAPAYYVCLVVALIFSSYLGHCREQIAQVLPRTITSMDRYYIAEPLTSFFIHASFIFGFLPSFSFSTPLPDWSLGLEMQFYLIFPLLFHFLNKNFAAFIIAFLLAMFGVWAVSNHAGLKYPMPSFLPLKFHNFAAGIVLGYFFLNREHIKAFTSIVVATFACLIIGNRTIYIPALFLFGLWWIFYVDSSKTIAAKIIQEVFRHRSSKFLSEMSYSLYISHLLLMLPFFSFILHTGRLNNANWMFFSLLLLALTLSVSQLIYKYVESPGINLGKQFLK